MHLDTLTILLGLALIAAVAAVQTIKAKQARMRQRAHDRYTTCTFDLLAGQIQAIVDTHHTGDPQ